MPRLDLAHSKAFAPRSAAITARAAAGVLLALALAGCGADIDAEDFPASQETGASEDDEENMAVIATVVGDGVDVYQEQGGGEAESTLANPNDYGADRTFLVVDGDREWLKVLLPIRPNGSTGWIKADDVELSQTDWNVDVDLETHRFSVYRGAELQREGDIATGKEETPTPLGQYYFTELIKPTEDDSPYGAYAYGLSGFSESLETFAGGPGQLAIHGTNDETDLGAQVSHGCVRISNGDITWMAETLPLGTPVRIQ